MNANHFVKISSVISILLSIAGIVYVGYSFFNREPEEWLFRYVWGLIGWSLLLWGSIIGFLTCWKYNLEQEDARFFSYISCGILGYLVSYIMGASSFFVISFLTFTLILNRKKKIIQKYDDQQKESQKG